MASQTSRVGTAPGGRIEPTVAIGRPGTVTDRALVRANRADGRLRSTAASTTTTV